MTQKKTPAKAAGDLRTSVEAVLPACVELRRELHRFPELSYQEHRTAERIVKELNELGIAHKPGVAQTGVLAHIPATVETKAKATALRADIDALPILEQTGAAYASQNSGVMHACGHDGHTAILLGVARVLAGLAHRPRPVTLLFQPAEEGGAGGLAMCKEGALKGARHGGLGPPVGEIFGLHGWPTLELGTVATRSGPLMAAVDDFVVTIRGRQAHGAYPHQGHDPILAAAHVITAIQSIASRNVGPLDSVVVSVGQIKGGTASNIIPETVELVGTVRTLREATRTLAKERFTAVVSQTAKALGCQAEIDYQESYPVTHNDAGATETFLDTARGALGQSKVEVLEFPTMGGEDFSYYGAHVPACFFFLGLRPNTVRPADVPLLHQSTFDFNDKAIPVGVELMCRLALRP